MKKGKVILASILSVFALIGVAGYVCVETNKQNRWFDKLTAEKDEVESTNRYDLSKFERLEIKDDTVTEFTLESDTIVDFAVACSASFEIDMNGYRCYISSFYDDNGASIYLRNDSDYEGCATLLNYTSYPVNTFNNGGLSSSMLGAEVSFYNVLVEHDPQNGVWTLTEMFYGEI